MIKSERDVFQSVVGLFRDQVGLVIELVRHAQMARQAEEADANARRERWLEEAVTRRLELEAAATSSADGGA